MRLSGIGLGNLYIFGSPLDAEIRTQWGLKIVSASLCFFFLMKIP